MKILMLGLGIKPHFDLPPHYAESYIRDVPDYEIITFGYNDGVDIKIEIDDDFDKVVRQLPENWQPDFCLMYNLVQNLCPRGIENAPFPTIYLSLDWDYHVLLAKTNAQAVDLQLVGGEYARDHVRALDVNRMEAFYDCGIMREYFPETPLPIKDRPYDLIYTANVTDVGDQGYDRMCWVYKLCDLAEKYKVRVLVAHHFSTYQEYLHKLQQSKLALSYNRDGHISFRVLEAGSQGTVILDTGEQIKKRFEPHQEFIPVNEKDFFDQVLRALSDLTKLQAMSDRFLSKIKAGFESRMHFTKIIELAAGILKDADLKRKYSTLSEHEKHIRRGELYYYLYFRGAQGGYFPGKENQFFALSQKEYQQAISIRTTPRLQLDLAIVTASQGILSQNPDDFRTKTETAISILEELISTHPDYTLAYYNLGHFYLRPGNIQKAYDFFQIAAARFRDPASIVDEWTLHIREHDYERSKLQLGRQLDDYLWQYVRGEQTIAKQNIRNLYLAAAIYYLGLLEKDNGYLQKSLNSFGESVQIYPKSSLVTLEAARMATLLGYQDQALRFYQKTLQLAPFEMSVRFEFTKLLHFFGMKEMAIRMIKEAVKLAKTVVVLQKYMPELKAIVNDINSADRMTQNLLREKILNNWIDKLTRYFQMNPNDGELFSRLVDLWDQSGRLDKSLDLVENFINRNPSMNDSTVSFLSGIHKSLVEKCNQQSQNFQYRLQQIQNAMPPSKKPVEFGSVN